MFSKVPLSSPKLKAPEAKATVVLGAWPSDSMAVMTDSDDEKILAFSRTVEIKGQHRVAYLLQQFWGIGFPLSLSLYLPSGHVTGIDVNADQLQRGRRLCKSVEIANPSRASSGKPPVLSIMGAVL